MIGNGDVTRDSYRSYSCVVSLKGQGPGLVNVLWARARKHVFVVKATLVHTHNSEIELTFTRTFTRTPHQTPLWDAARRRQP